MHFHSIFQCSGETRTTILKGSSDYEDALRYASSAMKESLLKVEKVHCPTLHGWFMVRNAEYRSRGYVDCLKTLIHVTGASNITSILRKNLDWRCVKRAKFGTGVSFADDADYANKYAVRAIGSDRAMIIADVLVGHTSEYCTSLPSSNVDTTTGNNHVYVKYYDDEFLPKYIVYYCDDTPIPVKRFRWSW